MKCLKINICSGATLIELITVLLIISALAAIALPHFAGYRAHALRASCASNRYHIKQEERSYYLTHKVPNLKIDGKYVCPSGGIYVWLVSDPSDPRYPEVGCSIHFAGSP
jgi:prepilin-type N-terminal cleavage/methylation domain-containing protein